MPMSPVLDLPESGFAEPANRRADAAGQTLRRPCLFSQPLVPVLTTVIIAGLVVLAISTARSAGLVAALWGAGGLAVAVWLRSGRGRTYDLAFGALVMVGIAAGELLAGNNMQLTVMFTVANMIEIVAAVLLARRFAPTLNLASVEGACRFLLCAAVAAPIPAALFSAGMLNAMNGQSFIMAFQTWWFGHTLGLAVITPFGLALTQQHFATLRRPYRMAETIGLLSVLGVVSALVFWRASLPVSFLVIPILILIAVRLRVLGITTGLVVVTIAAVSGTLLGHGPMSADPGLTLSESVTLAQLFVLLACLPFILVASLLEERDRFAARAQAGQVRAERASEAKSRLLANVAHEIKSPVGGIIGIGELWSTGQLGPITPTQAEMSEILVKTARQVEALSHDLLDVARAESGAVKIELRPTDVTGVLEDVRRSLALRPEAQALRLDVVCEGDGLVAMADSQRLTQVIGNLATNAAKYGALGGIIVFRALRIHDGVRIEVIDHGPGLTTEKQAQLFEPFNRLGLERTTVEGHGIGLALAKSLTELQGGSIGVNSVSGQGATFWIELPAA